MTTDAERESKLIRVGYPLIRGKLTFRPTEPTDEPVSSGPLVREGYPVIRGKLTFRPVLFLKLRLTLPAGATDGAIEAVAAKVVELVDAINALDGVTGGTGFKVTAQQAAASERVVELVLRPNDMTNAESRLAKVAELLKVAGPGGATVTGGVYAAAEPERPLLAV